MALTPFLISFAVGFLLIGLSPRLVGLIRRNDMRARQATHVAPTLRLGGVGLYVALWFVADVNHGRLSEFGIFLLCATPLFVAGLLEDLGVRQSIFRRLVAAVMSCLFVVLTTQTYIAGLDVDVVDSLFKLGAFAIAFTLLASVGIVNAFNLIDGLNGLASAAALVSIAALVVIAQQTGHENLIVPAIGLGAALFGFFLLNFPKGKIFLGDGGAYLTGFLLAWIAIDLMQHEPSVSPWAVLLVLFWPIADTLWAIWRRAFRKIKVAHADRMHFHHVLMRLLEIRFLGRGKRHIANPLATAILVILMVPPAATGVLFATDTPSAIAASVVYTVLFLLAYRFAVRLASRRGVRPSRLGDAPSVSATSKLAPAGDA